MAERRPTQEEIDSMNENFNSFLVRVCREQWQREAEQYKAQIREKDQRIAVLSFKLAQFGNTIVDLQEEIERLKEELGHNN